MNNWNNHQPDKKHLSGKSENVNGWSKALKYNPNIFVRKKIQKMANCVLPWIQLLSSCYRCCWRPELKMFSRFVDKPMNWNTADKLCRRHGGQLVEIDSLEEQKALVKESRSRKYWRTKKQFWMGLTDRKVPDDKQFHSSTFLYLFRKAESIISWSWLGNVRANGCWSLLERDQASLIGRGIEIFFESLTPMFLTHQNVILEGFNPQQQTPPSNLNKSGLFKQFLPKISCKDFAFKGQICKETLNW